MVLVAIMDLVEQVLVFKAKHLVLQQGHIGPLVLDLLQTLLLLLVIAHEMGIFPLLLLELMIDFKELFFGVELGSDVITINSAKIDEAVTFYNWVPVSKCRRVILAIAGLHGLGSRGQTSSIKRVLNHNILIVCCVRKIT